MRRDSPTDDTGIPKQIDGQRSLPSSPYGCQIHVRLNVRVGLWARLCCSDGMPSRIPSSSPNDDDRWSRRGSGRLESGPARFCRASKLVRLRDFVVALERGELVPDDADGIGAEYTDISSSSSDSSGGELNTPAGSGRGPRSSEFSRLCSCACCCRIVCLSVDIWVRIATIRKKW